MHVDLKVGLAVAVDVAFDGHVGAVLDKMQLACLVVEFLRADELEVLIAVLVRVGVDAVNVNAIALESEIVDELVDGGYISKPQPGSRWRCKPQRRGAGEIEHHGFATRGTEPFLHGLAQKFGAVTIGKREAGLLRQHLMREIGRHGEIEPVAKIQILMPFAVGLEIDRGRI